MKKLALIAFAVLLLGGIPDAKAQMGAAQRVEPITSICQKTTFSVQKAYNVINDYSLLVKHSGGAIAKAEKRKGSTYEELHLTLSSGAKIVLNIYPYPDVTATTYSVISPAEYKGVGVCTTVKEDGEDSIIELSCSGNVSRAKQKEVGSFVTPLFKTILKGYKTLE